MLGRKERRQPELFVAGSIRDLVPDNHVLVRVDRVLDLGWLHEEVVGLYDATTGRPSIDPEVAVRLMLAGFLHGFVHDRRLMREAQVNLAIRWFCGYGLHEVLPDHSSLTRIRQRWGADRFRRIFERTVRTCLEAKIATAEIVHIDASLIRADVTWESLVTRHVEAVAGANPDDEDAARRARKTEIGNGKYYTRQSGEVLHEAREDRNTLEVIKRQLGTAAFEAQYQQRPFPPGGTLIKQAWLPTYPEELPREEYDQVVQSWDTASTVSESSDYSVCITFGIVGQTVHVLDVARVQLEYPQLRRRVMAEANKWEVDAVLIERSSSGIALMQDLRFEGLLRPISYKPRVDKVARLEGHSAKIEAGYILLPEEAPWLDDFKAELLAFPQGRHDDQVDALSQFLEWLARRRRTDRHRAEDEERGRARLSRQDDTRRSPARSTWYDRNMGGLSSNKALLARYGRGIIG